MQSQQGFRSVAVSRAQEEGSQAKPKLRGKSIQAEPKLGWKPKEILMDSNSSSPEAQHGGCRRHRVDRDLDKLNCDLRLSLEPKAKMKGWGLGADMMGSPALELKFGGKVDQPSSRYIPVGFFSLVEENNLPQGGARARSRAGEEGGHCYCQRYSAKSIFIPRQKKSDARDAMTKIENSTVSSSKILLKL